MARILVIDDDPRVREVLSAVLNGAGHEVSEAADGTAISAVLDAGAADLVVCDLFMPERDGIEAIRSARQTAPTVPLVAISGGGSVGPSSVLEMAAALGAAAALPKPVRARVLVELVSDLLAGRSPAPPPCADAETRAATAARVCPRYHVCDAAGSSAWCGPWPR